MQKLVWLKDKMKQFLFSPAKIFVCVQKHDACDVDARMVIYVLVVVLKTRAASNLVRSAETMEQLCKQTSDI